MEKNSQAKAADEVTAVPTDAKPAVPTDTVNPEDIAPKGVEVLKLYKPVKWEDTELTELRMDFDSMTGDDLEAAEREWIASGGGAGVAETSKSFLNHIVAKASGNRVEVIRKLNAKDSSKATMLAMNFLLG